MQHKKKWILAVGEDLMFVVKINEFARRAGYDVVYSKSEDDTVAKAQDKPSLVLLDLNINALDPVQLIAKLKSNVELKKISIVSYISHVQAELKQKAQEAGADQVMARSAFSTNLPQILKRHAETFS